MKKTCVGKAIRKALMVPTDTANKQKTVRAVAVVYGQGSRRIGFFAMLCAAFSHTSVLFWLLSAALYLCVGFSAVGQPALIVGAPLLAAIGFSEWSKSFYYGMWELEKTCRFDLRRLLLLKLSMTGFANTALLLTANFLTTGKIHRLSCAVCTMAAFAVSNFIYYLLFEIIRIADLRILLSATALLCGAATLLCCLADAPSIIGDMRIWLTVLAVFAAGSVVLIRKTMKNEEVHDG